MIRHSPLHKNSWGQFDVQTAVHVAKKKKNKEFQFSTLKFKWGGGDSISFWWVCAALVFKSRVYRTDFFFKKLGSREQIFTKISMFGAEILPIG